MAIFEPLFAALNAANVRYVVVGGLAVVLHGHARLTVDVDLIVDLDPFEAAKAIDVLAASGLQPRLPVNASDFANATVREAWVRERGMKVFSMLDPNNPMRVVDLFAEYPIPFDELWESSVEFDLRDTTVRVVSIPHLIRLKRLAGRPQDQADIVQLEAILRARQASDDG